MNDDPLPADFFDLIGGTYTGGLIALLLGRLRLSVPQARREYVKIANEVFSIKRFFDKSKFDGKALEMAVKQVLQKTLGPGRESERMLDRAKPACGVFVSAVLQQDAQARAGPTLFRTYKVREHATYDCTIWEASRATSAAPAYFDAIAIGESGEEEVYVDGGLGYNNPIEQVLEEARRQFPRRKVACIVSIGAGLAREIRFPDTPKTNWSNLVHALKKMATESDTTAERVQARYREAHDTYFRFSVDRGLDNIDLAECEKISNVRTYTTGYMRQTVVSAQIDSVVRALLASKAEPGPDASTSMIPVSTPTSTSVSGAAGSQRPPQMLPWTSTGETTTDIHYKVEDVVPTTKVRAWSVPFEKNPDFTGRESEFKKLRDALFTKEEQTAKVAVAGLGGIGKTQLVLAMAYHIRDEFKDCCVLWMPCTSRESIEKAFAVAAKELNIPGAESDKADTKALVRDHLSKESAGRWLLVFDNADDISIWFNQSAGESGRLIDYLPKSQHGSIIFTTRVKKEAVRLTGRNIIEMSAMDEDGGKQLLRNYLLDKDLVDNREDTAALLARLTYLPLAIVQAAAYINANDISLRDYLPLLNEQEEEVIDLLSEDFEDEWRYRDVQNPVATTWLVSFAQVRQRDPLAADYLSFMACIDAKDIPPSLLPPGPSQKKVTDAMGTLQGYSFGRWDEAEKLDVQVMETRRWDEAEKLEVQVMETSMEKLGADHYNTILSMSSLASTFWNQGRLDEAEKLEVQVMETRKRILGADHPYTLTSIADLALTIGDQGRWDEAEKLEVQVMEMSKTILGADHPETLGTMP
ncbi:hypothetical protein SPBR_05564 [Sporothrix brasiliensis 5110]|uniref:PNPLA domain-containing protein n=1 Tax=Sporothrix brasiliensis 5110 TaxID=1398154 RepID=A0A0C2FT43_9PEZI|nr:uncharacterized protein SPBR_05564 [Sporothrix brasiliensis 5110]KIH94168.1 hypothetical protein SPBR_05564 [Sporothrix brasiliensis 5110]